MTSRDAPTPTASPRFGSYPEYRDSGVEGLGQIPGHWEARRLKNWLVTNRNVLPENTDPDYEFAYVDIGSVGTGRLLSKPERLRFAAAPSRARRVVRHQDTIVSTVRTYLKAVWHVTEERPDLIVSTGFAVLTPGPHAFAKFVSYVCQSESFTSCVSAESTGVSYPAIAEIKLEALPVGVPPLEEQCAIAEFLDRETARIDALVAKKEGLICQLRKKRTGLISHAVTKGLDPDAPMKESGVGWLGRIPEHWDVRRLKACAAVRLSNVDKKSVEGERPVLLCNYVDVYYHERIENGMNFMAATATRDQIRRFSLKQGDVLITKDSETWTDIAVPALVAEDLPEVLCGYHLALIRPRPDYVGAFLARALSAVGLRNQYHVAANGITRFGLTVDAITTGLFPSPPVEEQRAIADFLDRETGRIDGLIAKVEEGIERLREYRTAVISAAVTGQIDVRDGRNGSAVAGGEAGSVIA